MPLRDVEGQGHAIEALRRALQGGRLHHAYLFAGPDGVGKGMAARAMAEALLCEVQAGGDACGECRACRRARERQHPDLHVVERQPRPDGQLETFIRINQVRDLQRDLSYKRFEAARRVVLLYEAERMNAATANALLKTLEEPGPDTHFVLVTAEPHRLLPTILSRCQRVRFNPLPRALVAKHLAAQLDLHGEAADLLAGLAEGSISKGLALAGSPVLERRADLIARLDDPKGLHRVRDLLDLADELGKGKDALPLVFHLLRTWYRDLLLVQQGVGSDALVHRDLAERLAERAAQLRFADVAARIDRLNEAEQAIFERNANVRLALETCFLHLVGVGRRGAA